MRIFTDFLNSIRHTSVREAKRNSLDPRQMLTARLYGGNELIRLVDLLRVGRWIDRNGFCFARRYARSSAEERIGDV